MVAHPMAEGVAQALYREGAIKSPDVKSISLDEAASSWPPPFGGNGAMVELGLSSNSRTKSTVGRGLGGRRIEARRSGGRDSRKKSRRR